MSRIAWDIESVCSLFEKHGCILLTAEYTGVKSKYKFICTCGNESEKRLNDYVKRPMCRDCGNRNGRGIFEYKEFLRTLNRDQADCAIIRPRGTSGEKDIKVDREDFEFLMEGALWSVNKRMYASRHKYGTKTKEKIHRVILGITDPLIIVDHINGDTLDNRRQNLRIVTCSENTANSKIRLDVKVPYKGVTRAGNRYKARIGVGLERIYLGSFATAEDAALAYNNAALKYFGEFAKLNKIGGQINDAN